MEKIRNVIDDGFMHVFDRFKADKQNNFWRYCQKNDCLARIHTNRYCQFNDFEKIWKKCILMILMPPKLKHELL